MAGTTQNESIRRVLSGGRVTISQEERRKMGVKIGDYVIVRVRQGCLEIVPCKVVPR